MFRVAASRDGGGAGGAGRGRTGNGVTECNLWHHFYVVLFSVNPDTRAYASYIIMFMISVV